MTRWEQWLQNLIGDDRRTFICGKYKHCQDCFVYVPCMVERTEDDFKRNREEFDQAIDEWLDTEIEEGIRYTTSDSLFRDDKYLPLPEEDKEGNDGE